MSKDCDKVYQIFKILENILCLESEINGGEAGYGLEALRGGICEVLELHPAKTKKLLNQIKLGESAGGK